MRRFKTVLRWQEMPRRQGPARVWLRDYIQVPRLSRQKKIPATAKPTCAASTAPTATANTTKLTTTRRAATTSTTESAATTRRARQGRQPTTAKSASTRSATVTAA